MTQKKDIAKTPDWKEIFGSGPDGLRSLVQEVVQEVLEAEMDETVGAQKSERTPDRVGYRAGYYTRTFVTQWGSWCCGFRRTGKEDSGRKCSSAISAVKRHW